MTWKTALSLLVPWIAASPALAAGGEGGPSHEELIWQAINLVLLLAVIVYATRKAIPSFFAERRERIQSDLEESADYLKGAEGRFAEWQRKLAELDSEVEKIRATARLRANEERDRILADAQETAERIKSDAKAAVDQELRRAGSTLRDEASDLAIELAAKLIRDQIADSDRSRLVDEFIGRVEAGSSESGGNA